MPRFLALVLVLLLGGTTIVLAQNAAPQVGDPPIAALITVGPADAAGIVTIHGATGAVFPGAQVAVRNLFTEQVTYTQAGLTGSFEARLFGPGSTPFWISPAASIPNTVRNRPGSLPGGPGTIVYGSLAAEDVGEAPVTQLVIDGSLDDWSAYPAGRLRQANQQDAYALRNRESLYMALVVASPPDVYSRLAVIFTLEGATYRVVFDPRLPEEAATWTRLSPLEADLGTLAAAKTQGDAIELRIPLSPLRSVLGAQLDNAQLDRFEFLAADDSALLTVNVIQAIPPVDEVDGIVYPARARMSEPIRFSVAGSVAQGASIWHAEGRLNQQNFEPGDALHMQMDVTFDAPDLPETLVGVSMIGQVGLQPLVGADGQQATGGAGSNNGWSAVLTPSGLPIDNLRSDFVLGEAVVPAPQVLRRNDSLIFGIEFDLMLPEDLPDGVYGLVFEGYGQIADGERFHWEDNGVFGSGDGVISRLQVTRLPVLLNVGDVPSKRLIWSLFQDNPSEGSRGLLADEDQGHAALSNRVRFNSPTYILPPFAAPDSQEPLRYGLEPYLVSLMTNAPDSTGAPIIPFDFPSGELAVQITRPDGTLDDLGRSAIVQNRLSTAADDDRTLFGGQSQVDEYRLTTLNPILTGYQFAGYGPYAIDLRGSIEDAWGNRYEGGGTYHVLIAETLDLLPGVLPGTPFEVGDQFYGGLMVSPGAPADVTVTARIYPLDGSPMIEQVMTGPANTHGYFADDGFEFTTPGEYVVDYEARYTDAQGRLWAGSLRSAGVIGTPKGALIAHGRRGLNDYYPGIRPAWFTSRRYDPESGPLRLMSPYQTGDVLWYAADTDNTVRPAMSVQDTALMYAQWLSDALPDYRAPDGQSMARRAARGELPVIMMGDKQPDYNPVLQSLTNDAYAYFSVVRPGLSVRQFVQGSDDPGLLLYWDMNDPYNEQIGSGLTGDLAGDYVFMFGGAVVRNPDADIAEAAIYGSAGFAIEDRGDTLGARIYPPYRGAAGGADGGPLLTVRGEPVTMFFHPTGVRPGQILTVGDTLAVAGQVAPTLASNVDVTITSPAGDSREFSGEANAIGYFYDPANDLTVDQPGVWTVEIHVQQTGLTSAGVVEPPYPEGDVLGTEGGRFSVYVVPPDATELAWHDTRQDIVIPGALPYNFNLNIPDGWTNAQVDHTVTIPGFVLRSGPLPINGTSFSFQHNPTNLNAVFPNVEVDARLHGPAAADPVTLT
ncbi:MAG: hypothetical protein K8J31_21820, partial [Anaerolineae bacterium]|nr:hypothetical protein [Anaerolineae bacterium]